MKPVLADAETLRNLFAGLVEDTFQVELGVADPSLTDYLSSLLVRFVRCDAIYRIRNATGQRLYEVAEMLLEAEEREDRPQHEIHRHVGDFTLFWAGVFPEALKRLQGAERKDHLLDYCQQGKRAYYLASTCKEEPFRSQSELLRRLSDEFELCSFGLNRVRNEWEKMPGPSGYTPERN